MTKILLEVRAALNAFDNCRHSKLSMAVQDDDFGVARLLVFLTRGRHFLAHADITSSVIRLQRSTYSVLTFKPI